MMAALKSSLHTLKVQRQEASLLLFQCLKVAGWLTFYGKITGASLQVSDKFWQEPLNAIPPKVPYLHAPKIFKTGHCGSALFSLFSGQQSPYMHPSAELYIPVSDVHPSLAMQITLFSLLRGIKNFEKPKKPKKPK